MAAKDTSKEASKQAEQAASSLVSFICPDFGRCGAGFGAVMPACAEGFAYCGAEAWEADLTGQNQWLVMTPCEIAPLMMCGFQCVPCCGIATTGRTMSKVTGRTCEEEACIACCLPVCCMYPCYFAKMREPLRKKYDLRGSNMNDCCNMCFFGSFAMAQTAMEVQRTDATFKVPYAGVHQSLIQTNSV